MLSKTLFHNTENGQNGILVKQEVFENDQVFDSEVFDDTENSKDIAKKQEIFEKDQVFDSDECIKNPLDSMKEAPPNVFDNTENSKNIAKKHSCPKCSETFNNVLVFVKHFNKIHKDKYHYLCPLCPGRKFRHMGHVKEHVQTIHMEQDVLKNILKRNKRKVQKQKGEKIQCEYCPAFYFFQKSFKIHMKINHPEKNQDDEIWPEECEVSNYTCSKCDKNYTDLLMVWFTFNP